MSRYELLTFLHIASGVIWLGAGFLFAVLILRAERAGDGAREAGYHRDVGELGVPMFVPASLSTFVFGLLLVIDSPAWNFDQTWITLALAGWLTAFVLGFFYFKPEGQRIGELAAERGPNDPEVVSRIRRLNIVDRLQLALLFLVLLDMVLKPGIG